MRAIFVLFDTLNRHFLECYGGSLLQTPNFKRLAEKSVTFDNHHVGSLPCMPARRDLMTGRLSFMHRSWGPLEPFDNPLPTLLHAAGVYSHLVTDHYHYFEIGGAGYHNTFTSYEFHRGQEGDQHNALVAPPLERWRQKYHPAQYSEKPRDIRYHYMANREMMASEADFSSVKCFDSGLTFLETNRDADDWLLQIETFDPHEPFHAPERLRAKFPTAYEGPIRDWPPYARVSEDEGEADEMRANYMALLAHCDEQLGRLLDTMDALDLWKDTMLVVTTDHGYLTGEHDWWAKNRQPAYREIEHIPLFIHHPHHVAKDGTRRGVLTQTPDLMPTFLDAFGCEIPPSVRARSLLPALADPEAPGPEAVIFGYFGGAINVTDGRYTYFRYPPDLLDQELYQYTLMPCHMLTHFARAEFERAELVAGGAYSEGVPVLKVPVIPQSPWYTSHGPAAMEQAQSLLFDTAADPMQATPLDDPAQEARMQDLLIAAMRHQNAPPEAFARLGLAETN